MTGAIQETSKAKPYDELSLHPLIKRHWFNELIFFHKTVNGLLSLLIFGFPLSNKLSFTIGISLCY